MALTALTPRRSRTILTYRLTAPVWSCAWRLGMAHTYRVLAVPQVLRAYLTSQWLVGSGFCY